MGISPHNTRTNVVFLRGLNRWAVVGPDGNPLVDPNGAPYTFDYRGQADDVAADLERGRRPVVDTSTERR